MIVYHGSNVPVETPKILRSERMLDFGEGFYTTYNREQAVRWCERVASREKTTACVISEYEFDMQAAEQNLSIVRFNSPDTAWLDFVCANRLGKKPQTPYDIAIGPVANDMVYTVILLYEQGAYDEDEAIKRLKIQELYNQVLFHTERALQYCRYIKHEEIRG
ncbi:MAG: DUF3990 domain-containing protein [Oscillospiraceae bacterium]|nr:DUF3990 domain-containing protein [Oscillospiraceae bacterium]